MTWSVVNAIKSAPNSFGEIKIDKMTQTERIDPVDAIIDAWKVWLASKQSNNPSGEEALDIWLQSLEEGGASKRCPFHHRGLECKKRKSRYT